MRSKTHFNDSMADTSIEIARLQNEIAKKLGLHPENVLFNYADKNNNIQLDLITINPRHEQSFLYHSELGIDKIEALKKMMSYVTEHHHKESSYTIQWAMTGEGELNTSYFRGKSIYDVLDKFFYQRDPNKYKIFSVNLNPIS